jgi:hypothetical protein
MRGGDEQTGELFSYVNLEIALSARILDGVLALEQARKHFRSYAAIYPTPSTPK